MSGEQGAGPGVQTDETRRTILVVEDEVLVRVAAAEHLLDLGYDVLQAANADEALRVLAVRRDIDLVFSDHNMPGRITGHDLAHVIRRDYPRIKFLLTSGGWSGGSAGAEIAFLAKPYRLSELRDRLQEILEST